MYIIRRIIWIQTIGIGIIIRYAVCCCNSDGAVVYKVQLAAANIIILCLACDKPSWGVIITRPRWFSYDALLLLIIIIVIIVINRNRFDSDSGCIAYYRKIVNTLAFHALTVLRTKQSTQGSYSLKLLCNTNIIKLFLLLIIYCTYILAYRDQTWLYYIQ